MLGVTVNHIIMVDGKFKVITEGFEETSFYEGCRSGLNTGFALRWGVLVLGSIEALKEEDQYLTAREAHSDNAELVL